MATSSIRQINPLDAWIVNTNREPVGVALWRNRDPVMFTSGALGSIQASLYGNTAGAASTVNGTGLYLHGGNNVTLSNNAGTIVVSAAAGGAGDGYNILAAGGSTANTTGTILFSNSNGVSFGLNGATITAQHNGLTTARASNDAVGLNSAFTAGPLAMTVNSSGLSLNAGSAAGTSTGFAGNLISGSMTHNTAGLNVSLNHPAWLTTAAQVSHSHGNPTLNLTNINGTTASASNGLTLSLSAVVPAQTVQTQNLIQAVSASGTGANSTQLTNTSNAGLLFSNANGVTFSLSGNSIGASVNTAYLPLANSNNYFYTSNNTFANSTHSHGNPTLALTNIAGTTASASNGLTLSLSGVAAQTTQTQPAGNIAGVGTTFNGTNVTGNMTLNSNGLRLDLSAGAGGAGDGYNIVQIGTTGTSGTAWSSATATVQLNGSQNITVSQNNSNQVVIVGPSLAAYLTTAAQVSHSHGNPTLALTNISGTTASASNGLTLSLSGVAAQTTQTQPAGNIAGVGTTFAGANLSGSMTFNSNGLNLSMSAAAPGGGAAISNYVPFPLVTSASIAFSQNTQSMQYFNVPVQVAVSNVELYAKLTFVSSSNSQSAVATISYGMYSQDAGTNSTRMTLMGSSTAQMHGSFNSSTTASFHLAVGGSTAGTAGNSGVMNSFGANINHLYLPFATTLQPNVKYALGLLISSATSVGTSPLRLSGFMAQTVFNSSVGRLQGGGLVAPASTVIGDYDMAIYMTSTGAMVNSYATSQVSYVASRPKLFMQFDA